MITSIAPMQQSDLSLDGSPALRVKDELFPWGGEVGGFILKDQKQFNCYPTFNRFRTIDDRK